MTRNGKRLLTRRQFGRTAFSLGGTALLPRWMRASPGEDQPATPKILVGGANSLRAHAEARGLLYGVAVDPALLDVEGLSAGETGDRYTLLVATQANIVVAENAMKWSALRPTADKFDFTQADRMMLFAGQTAKRVRGHNLCWHEALPAWFKDVATKDNARQMLAAHIRTVAGRYSGQIHSWDVVNEAVNPNDNRADGLRKSPWLDLVGPDYIEFAFKTAAEADPQAKLIYNDFGIELDTAEQSEKRAQVLLLVRRLKARGMPIHGVGVQSHLRADGPQPGQGLVSFIREIAKLGLDVYITEMDVNTHDLSGDPDQQDAAVALIYSNYLGMVLTEPNVPVLLNWGITGAHCWLNSGVDPANQRADGTPQRPLPFDEKLKATAVFVALRTVLDVAKPVAAATPAAPQPDATSTQPAVATPPNTAPPAPPVQLYEPFPVKGSPNPPHTTPPPAPGPGY